MRLCAVVTFGLVQLVAGCFLVTDFEPQNPYLGDADTEGDGDSDGDTDGEVSPCSISLKLSGTASFRTTPRSLDFGDLDGDGHTDAVLAVGDTVSAGSFIDIYINVAGERRRFLEYRASITPISPTVFGEVRLADVHEAAGLELVAFAWHGADPEVGYLVLYGNSDWLDRATWPFGDYAVRHGVVANLDGDDMPDLVGSIWGGTFESAYLGYLLQTEAGVRGSYNKVDLYGAEPDRLVAGDFDGDGTDEVVVATASGDVSRLELFDLAGDVLSQRTMREPGCRVIDLVTADIENDSDSDPDAVIATCDGSGPVLYRVGADLDFGDPEYPRVSAPVLAIAAGDLDGDLDDDLIVHGETNIFILCNDGGTLVSHSSFSSPERSGTVLVGTANIDTDFRADVVVARNGLHTFLSREGDE